VSVAFDLSSIERRVAQIAGSEPHRTAAGLGAPAFASLVRAQAEHLIRREAIAARVDPALVLAVARVESGFDARATSATGAAGLMQLMPQTAQALGVENSYDPGQNVRGGARYLRELLDRFGGNISAAVAAYNAGPSAVERYGGPPPFAETQRYVASVLTAYRSYRLP